jgi:hypothetical protein
MPHENTDVASLDVFIAPDHRMIARVRGGFGAVGMLVNACQNVDVAPRRLVVGVSFLVLDL